MTTYRSDSIALRLVKCAAVCNSLLVALLCLGLPPQTRANLAEQLINSNFNFYSSPSPAGNMILQDLSGKTVDLSALKGKIIILNFWKINCAPCSAEKAVLDRINKKFASKGLEIICVNLFDPVDGIRSYAQQTGYGLRFAFDPNKKYTVRQEKLGPEILSSFVVNPSSQAIYEVPGVPTSYVINRKGQVIGHSVGMVDWEDEPFRQLLEFLLNEPPVQLAQHTVPLNDPIKQGPTKNPKSPAPASNLNQESPTRISGSQAPMPAPVAAPNAVQPSGVTVRETAQPARQTPERKAKNQNAESGQALQKPKIAENAAATKKRAATANQVKQTPKPAETQGTQTSQSPLPPAEPYYPGRTPISPAQDGTITARIPVPGQGASSSIPRSDQNLPPAQPSAGNKIGGSILDSFKSEPAAATVKAEPAARQMPSTVWGQIGQDVKDLGSGIKRAFSSISGR